MKIEYKVVLSKYLRFYLQIIFVKDRAHGNEFSNQFEESCQRLEEVCKGMDKKQQEQIELLALLTISEHFYDEQNREARIVTNVSMLS